MPNHQAGRHLPYLVWGDVDIQRTKVEGMFYVRMSIRNLKTNSDDPEKEVDNKTLLQALSAVGVDLELDFPQDEELSHGEDQLRDRINRGEPVDAYPDELPDQTVHVAEELSKVDYATAARAAMEVWLTVGTDESQFGTKQKQGSMVICPLCQEDETVDAETKAKLWAPTAYGWRVPFWPQQVHSSSTENSHGGGARWPSMRDLY